MTIYKKEDLNTFLHGAIPQLTFKEALSHLTRFVDVRTSEEFEDGSILGAINIPLFENCERAEIGTLYKQINKSIALERGKELISSRLSEIINTYNRYKNEHLTIYCARGGMRSASVVRLLKSLGFCVFQLKGGYKEYRQNILDDLDKFSSISLIVLHGKTGVGKTKILKNLPNSIDLEELAQHRSSLFGGINKEPKTQKQFETLLHHQLSVLDISKFVFIEGESRKVGQVFIPKTLAERMKVGKLVLLTASLENRIDRIIEDYMVDYDNTRFQLKEAIRALKATLGKNKTEWLCQCLDQNDLHSLVSFLLTEYYDRRYQHAMRNYSYDLTLSADNLEYAVSELINYRNRLE